MELLSNLFGHGDDLTPLQMGLRACTLYFFALILIRISGRRTFGTKTAYDHVVVILLSAILSRAAVGDSPYWSTVTAGFVIVSLHRLLAWISSRYHTLGRLTKGKEMLLYNNCRFHHDNMDKCLISERDLNESVRLTANTN